LSKKKTYVKTENFPSYYKNEPYDHQLKCISWLDEKENAALFLDMGTGKTFITITDVNRLYEKRKLVNVLVICPNSVKYTVWEEEIGKHSKNNNNIHIFSSKNKAAAKKWLDNLKCGQNNSINWFIMPVEALSQGSAHQYMDEFLQIVPYLTMSVIDESTTIKNPRAARTKKVIIPNKEIPYKRVLSGTPITKGVEDLYTQYFFLSKDIIDMKSYFIFRNRYCIMGGFQQKAIVGYKYQDELMKKLEPHTFQITKEECLDLPEKVYETRMVEMSPEQNKLYESMRKNLIAEIEGCEVVATVAVTKLLRLQQITGGFLSVPDIDVLTGKETVRAADIEGKNPKLNEVLSILDTVDAKVIIWCRFIAEIDAVHAALEKKGIRAVKSHGRIKQEERTAAVHDFQTDDTIRAYVGQPEGGGIGITLTKASLVIYYSNSFSSVAREQSESRAHRIGQVNKVTYIDLIMNDTIDKKIILAIRKKLDFSKIVMQSIKQGKWREVL